MKLALTHIFLYFFCWHAGITQSIVIASKDISWENFKGKPSGDYFAETNSAMKINLVLDQKDSVVQCIISATFNENLSYARKDLFSSYQKNYLDFLFQHEKYHYLITVVHCKKLVRLLKENSANSKTTVMAQYYQIDSLCRGQQLLYDAETHHAFDIQAQNDWFTRIDRELEVLKDIKIPGE